MSQRWALETELIKNTSLQLLDGIFNLMIQLGIWEDEPVKVREPIISTEGEVNFLTAKESGIFVPAINSCGIIHMGDNIGDIIEPIEGRILQHIESPMDGIVFTLRKIQLYTRSTPCQSAWRQK